jgi:hypothetical protein
LNALRAGAVAGLSRRLMAEGEAPEEQEEESE